MSKYLQTLLLFIVLSTLVFLAYRSYDDANKYIQTTKEISSLNNTDQAIQKKVDQFLEELSMGLYKGYTKNSNYLDGLNTKAAFYHERSIDYLYYFFGTVVVFIILFALLDIDLLYIFIGLSALIALITALFSPLLIMTVFKSFPVIGEVTLSYESKSIYGTISKLYHHSDYLVGTLVLLFSVLIPLVKSLFIALYGFIKETGFANNLAKTIEKIGKWSMADVFIVAVLVVFFSTKQDIHTSLKIEVGLYFFAGYVLLSILGSSLLGRKKQEV